MPGLVVAAVLGAMILLIFIDCLKDHLQRQHQKQYEQENHLRLMKEIQDHGSD